MAKKRFLIVAVLGLLCVSSAAVADEAVGTGDFEFFVDVAGFRTLGGATRQEVYLRIPSAQVSFKESKGVFEGKAVVTIKITDERGEEAVREALTLGMYADSEQEAASPLSFQTLIKEYDLAPGRYRLSCVVEDQYAPKVTIVGMVRGKVKTSMLLDWPLEVPDLTGDDVMMVSDAKFLWQVEKRRESVLYHPNPTRLYGLYRDSLRVYMEAYVPKDMAASRGVEFETLIMDDKGEVVKRSSIALPDLSDPRTPLQVIDNLALYSLVFTEDLNSFPAGRYTLYVNAGLDDELVLRARAGNFSVAWDLRTWELSRRNIVAEARFLLKAEEFEGFASRGPGEQEQILKKMWKEIDPDPLTGVNEAYQEFLSRLAYVNAKYSDYQLGFMTDRGLIYLKYGPPDEMIVDVIPLNRESVSDALQKVEDRFHAVNFSNTGGRIGYARPSKSIIVDPRRLGAVGEGGDVAYPYELWVYNNRGQPLLERDDALEQNIGLRFIFIDREGYGRYKLESSSSLANK